MSILIVMAILRMLRGSGDGDGTGSPMPFVPLADGRSLAFVLPVLGVVAMLVGMHVLR